ncbi:hypothetical protein KLP40_14450 [Hymenobacter sp. NST-14]|uniref:hypothetical protein n=1 Tax=Hymenobacter piscis TaxID=2839984 RepID=UPI001C01A532|nr:hypothetical protein [Hymenobacter piscis]MBT9394368.1 hypothetical protein [Hymenobacter piscis]
MKNLLTTIPQRGELRHWADVEKILQGCDSEDDFWSFSCRHYPKESGPGQLCFMIHSGFVRGYFTILDFSDEDILRHGADQENPAIISGKKVILAVWRPISPIAHTGFQGWRYTDLKP